MKQEINLIYRNIFVIVNKQTNQPFLKMAMGQHPTENEALRQFEVLQGFDTMIYFQSDAISYISLVVISEISPRGKEVMRYNLTDITSENRKTEILSNNARFKDFKKQMSAWLFTKNKTKEIEKQNLSKVEFPKKKENEKPVIEVKPKLIKQKDEKQKTKKKGFLINPETKKKIEIL